MSTPLENRVSVHTVPRVTVSIRRLTLADSSPVHPKVHFLNSSLFEAANHSWVPTACETEHLSTYQLESGRTLLSYLPPGHPFQKVMIGVTFHCLYKVQGASQPWWPVASIVSGDVSCQLDTERLPTPQKSACSKAPEDAAAQPPLRLLPGRRSERTAFFILISVISLLSQLYSCHGSSGGPQKKGLHKTEEPHSNPSDYTGGVGPVWLAVRSRCLLARFAMAVRISLLVQHGDFFLWCLGRLVRVWPPPSTFNHVLVTWDFREMSSQPSRAACWLM